MISSYTHTSFSQSATTAYTYSVIMDFPTLKKNLVVLEKQSCNSIAGHNAKCIRDSILSGCTHQLIFKVRINWPIFESAFFDGERIYNAIFKWSNFCCILVLEIKFVPDWYLILDRVLMGGQFWIKIRLLDNLNNYFCNAKWHQFNTR